MRAPSLPPDEARRLAALAEYQLLDTQAEPAYDAFVRLAKQSTGASVAAITLIDEHRQWFKAREGLDIDQTPRDAALCAHVIASGTEIVVSDASADERFRDDPFVSADPKIRFYAAVPLKSPEGYAIGTLCVMDGQPRDLAPQQREAMRELATALMTVLEGRRKFLALLESARIDLFTVDPSTRTIVFGSRGACSRLGYALPDLIGTPVNAIMPELGEFNMPDLLERGRRGEELLRESELLRHDGSSYPVELRIDVTTENGEERMVIMAIDLTQRREQQREIALLLGAVNAAGDVILVYTAQKSGRLALSYANDAFMQQTGYSRDEAIGQDVEFFRKSMPDDEGMRAVREAFASGNPMQAEIVSYRKDGSTYWNQVTLHPVRDAGSSVASWISIERNISDEVERNAALAEEHDRLLMLTRAARRLFTTLDATSIVTTAREVVAQLMRMEARVIAVNDEGASVAVDQLGVPAWDRSLLDPLADRAVSSRVRVEDAHAGRSLAYAGRFGDARYVLEVQARSGRSLRATDLFVFDLIAEYFAVAVRNVALYHEIEERRSAVLELNQTKSDLIAMLAHDFRGPLTSIVGFADLVGEVGETNDEQNEFLTTIKNSALQLSELATDTLTLSRMERNEVALQLGNTDIGALVAAIAAQHKDRRHVELVVDGDANVTGDEDRLRQVFANLIDNAIKYTPGGPDPRVRVAGGHDSVTVTVRDFGIGIPPGELSRIFDRFARAANARKLRIPGTGFGLYLAKQLVHLHGGSIAVESQERKGTTFTVTLPRRVDRRSAPRSVLLLDSERDGSFLAYGLQEAGYRVSGAAGIDEALELADTTAFDAIVLAAPESLTSEAAIQFRTFSREAGVPLVAIGGEASPRLGAAVTLSRPIAIGDVVTALERLLSGAS